MWSVQVELDPVRYWLRCSRCDEALSLQPELSLTVQAREFTTDHVCEDAALLTT